MSLRKGLVNNQLSSRRENPGRLLLWIGVSAGKLRCWRDPRLQLPLMSNPLVPALATGTVATALFYIVLIRWLKIDRSSWKKLRYLFIAIAAIGVVSAASDVRRQTANVNLVSTERFAAGEYGRAVSRLDLTQGTNYCFRDPDSEAVQPLIEVCRWGRQAMEVMPVDHPSDFTEFDVSTNLPPTSELTAGTDPGQAIWEVFRTIDSYNRTAEEVRSLRSAAEETVLESILFYFTPYMLAVSAAYALAYNRFEIVELSKQPCGSCER